MLPRQPDVTWEFYTDGSRDPDSCNTGAGLVVYKNGIQTFCESYNIGDRTVFQGELYGVNKAAEWILDPNNDQVNGSHRVIIYSDCQSVLLALEQTFTKSDQLFKTMNNPY